MLLTDNQTNQCYKSMTEVITNLNKMLDGSWDNQLQHGWRKNGVQMAQFQFKDMKTVWP